MGEGAGESATAGSRNLESVKAAERVMEAIELATAQRDRPEGEAPSILLLGLSPEAYMLRALRMVRANDLEQALLVLPFHLVAQLFAFLAHFAEQRMQPELTARISFRLLRLHHKPIVANRSMLELLHTLRDDMQVRALARRVRADPTGHCAGLVSLTLPSTR